MLKHAGQFPDHPAAWHLLQAAHPVVSVDRPIAAVVTQMPVQYFAVWQFVHPVVVVLFASASNLVVAVATSVVAVANFAAVVKTGFPDQAIVAAAVPVAAQFLLSALDD